jgi:hypothetical protein
MPIRQTQSEEENMNAVCELSAEENVACQLADLAFRLHRRGLIDPYQKVVEARDALILILDEKTIRHSGQEKAAKREEKMFVANKANPLVAPERLPQGTETRKSERAAA